MRSTDISNTNNNKGPKMSIKAFRDSLKEFRRMFGPDCTAAQILVFCHIGSHEGCVFSDIIKATDLSKSGVSRIVQNFSPIDRNRKPGLGLIQLREDPHDRRFKGIYLSEKGKEFYSLIKTYLET